MLNLKRDYISVDTLRDLPFKAHDVLAINPPIIEVELLEVNYDNLFLLVTGKTPAEFFGEGFKDHGANI